MGYAAQRSGTLRERLEVLDCAVALNDCNLGPVPCSVSIPGVDATAACERETNDRLPHGTGPAQCLHLSQELEARRQIAADQLNSDTLPFRMTDHMTHSIEIFLAAHQAMTTGVDMIPRSANDKEYFAQDWFAARVAALGLPLHPQGRAGDPDLWVGADTQAPVEGYEIKSMALRNGRPARKDYDSRSIDPAEPKDDRDCFLVFLLYTGSGGKPRPIHSLCIAHRDLINTDQGGAAFHIEEKIEGFGSYGDGAIRSRKQYRFPSPFTLDPTGLGRCRLILPAEWEPADARLVQVGTLERSIAYTRLDAYSIDLGGDTRPTPHAAPRLDAGQVRRFQVFEQP